MHGLNVDELEFELLLEAIHRRWGYDLTHYSRDSLRRRLEQALEATGFSRFTELLDRMMHDEIFFDGLLKYVSITVTEMFRDPPFYRAMRRHLIPVLKTFPFVKIWHAGCATGEEVYSMAILLHEEDFLDRARVYATDFNKHALDAAEKAVYPERLMKTNAANYRSSGGQRDFAEYYSSGYELAKVKDFLKDRITFSYHNLVADGVFGEMNVVCCRNVLIYFDRTLQERALGLFTDSLRHGGFLCLGSKESLNLSTVQDQFEVADKDNKIYKKIGRANS